MAKPILTITYRTNDLEDRLYDDFYDLAPEEYGLRVSVPPSLETKLVDAMCEKASSSDDDGFSMWLINSMYAEEIDQALSEALDEYIYARINDVAKELVAKGMQ